MIVKNDFVFFNKYEIDKFLIANKLFYKNDISNIKVNIKFLHKRNIISIIPKLKNGIILNRYKDTDYFCVHNIWCFKNDSIWKMKPIKRQGVFSGEYSLLSPLFKFRINRTETINIISMKKYDRIFFKSGRLYISDLDFKFKNSMYFRVDMLKMYFENNMLTLTFLDDQDIYNSNISNKKLKIDSNINFISKIDDSIFYKSKFLRTVSKFYGTLSNYKYVTTNKENYGDVMIFRK